MEINDLTQGILKLIEESSDDLNHCDVIACIGAVLLIYIHTNNGEELKEIIVAELASFILNAHIQKIQVN